MMQAMYLNRVVCWAVEGNPRQTKARLDRSWIGTKSSWSSCGGVCRGAEEEEKLRRAGKKNASCVMFWSCQIVTNIGHIDQEV